MIISYMEITGLVGIAVLSALGFYALRVLSSFKTGLLAKSWRLVTIGVFLLIFAQIPFLLGGSTSFNSLSTILSILGMAMRLVGVLFFILGLRAQSRIWRQESAGKEEDQPLTIER